VHEPCSAKTCSALELEARTRSDAQQRKHTLVGLWQPLQALLLPWVLLLLLWL
jgi:hypothetical protein